MKTCVVVSLTLVLLDFKLITTSAQSCDGFRAVVARVFGIHGKVSIFHP